MNNIMKFSDYMSLKEDSFGSDNVATPQGFDNAIEHKGFKDDSKDPDWSSDNKEIQESTEDDEYVDGVEAVKEACEYILSIAEECGLGCDKIDRPEGYGLDTAVNALNQFASAGDGENYSHPNIDAAMDFDDDDFDFEDDEDTCDESASFESVVEAAQFILDALNEAEEYDDRCDDDESTVENGIDKNTIVPHNDENDQFERITDGIDLDAFNNSLDWDD